jgi:hypothetical protein
MNTKELKFYMSPLFIQTFQSQCVFLLCHVMSIKMLSQQKLWNFYAENHQTFVTTYLLLIHHVLQKKIRGKPSHVYFVRSPTPTTTSKRTGSILKRPMPSHVDFPLILNIKSTRIKPIWSISLSYQCSDSSPWITSCPLNE